VAPASRRWKACPNPTSAKHGRDAGATGSVIVGPLPKSRNTVRTRKPKQGTRPVRGVHPVNGYTASMGAHRALQPRGESKRGTAENFEGYALIAAGRLNDPLAQQNLKRTVGGSLRRRPGQAPPARQPTISTPRFQTGGETRLPVVRREVGL
jgi:hypothetical protein